MSPLAGLPNQHCPFPGLPPLQLEKYTYLISQLLTQPGWPCDTVLDNGHKGKSFRKAFHFPKRADVSAPTPSPFPSLNTNMMSGDATVLLCLGDN